MTSDHTTDLSLQLLKLERQLGIRLLAYYEPDDDVWFGGDLLDDLEYADAAGIETTSRRPPVQLTDDQVAEIEAIEERFGVRLIGYCAASDSVAFGEDTIRELAETNGIDISPPAQGRYPS